MYSGLETGLSVGQVQLAGCEKGIAALYLVVAKLLNFIFLYKKGVHLALQVIHNPTAFINNYFYVLTKLSHL